MQLVVITYIPFGPGNPTVPRSPLLPGGPGGPTAPRNPWSPLGQNDDTLGKPLNIDIAERLAL